LTGSSGLAGSTLSLKKSKQRRFTKNKKSMGLQPSCRVNSPGLPGHTGFFLSLFFLQSGPILTSD